MELFRMISDDEKASDISSSRWDWNLAARARMLKGQSFHILRSRLFLFEFKKNDPCS